jgi:hypothetical protein
MSTPETPAYIIELNTISNPTSGIRDESRYRRCEACGSRLRYSNGLDRDSVCELLTDKHIELCRGNIGETLHRIQAWYRGGGDKQLTELVGASQRERRGSSAFVRRITAG